MKTPNHCSLQKVEVCFSQITIWMWANRVLPDKTACPSCYFTLCDLHPQEPPDLRPASRKGKGRKMEKEQGAVHLSFKEIPQSIHTMLLLNSPWPEPHNMTILSHNGNSEMPLWFFKLCFQLTYLGVITGKRGENEHWQTTSKLPWLVPSSPWYDVVCGISFSEDSGKIPFLVYLPYTNFLSTS